MGKRRSFFLYPLSLIYGLITSFRNFLYNSGIVPSEKFSLPIICIGNITVGGTGKTPHTEYLIDLLRKKFRVAVLSRGYKRKSKGYQVASGLSSVPEIGDEPLQMHRKFPDIMVTVDNDRVHGVKKILQESPETDLIILDDGFQHRKIKSGLSVLLSDFNNPVTDDFLLPYGNLRESVRNIRRADLIIITKSPDDIQETIRQEIINNFNAISVKRLFFTTISYSDPVPLFEDQVLIRWSLTDINPENHGLVLLTGIASPEPLKRYIEKYFSEIIHLKFADHHYFNENDILNIRTAFVNLKSQVKYIVTTEKDSVRLKEFANFEAFIKESFYYIPVRINFLDNGKQEFDNLISDYVRKNKRDNRIS
jgi:tetraacyldisaccharide 4'-kinase